MTIWRAVLAVLSAFAGIRRHRAAQGDEKLGWRQIVVTALLLAWCLAALLWGLVWWIGGGRE